LPGICQNPQLIKKGLVNSKANPKNTPPLKYKTNTEKTERKKERKKKVRSKRV
jgi:hypothetical protein